jgi:hypothetical protein
MECYLYRDGENVNRVFGVGCEKEGVNDAKEKRFDHALLFSLNSS